MTEAKLIAAGCARRLAACIPHGGNFDVHERLKDRGEEHGLAGHMKRVSGCRSASTSAPCAGEKRRERAAGARERSLSEPR